MFRRCATVDGASTMVWSTLQRRLRPRRRIRRTLIGTSALLELMAGWHLYPKMRIHALKAEIQSIWKFRDSNGHYPVSQAELDIALDQDAPADCNGGLRFSHDLYNGTDVKYLTNE